MWIVWVVVGIIAVVIIAAFILKKIGEAMAQKKIIDAINLLCKERNADTQEDRNDIAQEVFYSNLVACRDRQDFNMLFPSLLYVAPKIINDSEVLSNIYFDAMRFMEKCGVPIWDKRKFYTKMMLILPEKSRFEMN